RRSCGRRTRCSSGCLPGCGDRGAPGRVMTPGVCRRHPRAPRTVNPRLRRAAAALVSQAPFFEWGLPELSGTSLERDMAISANDMRRGMAIEYKGDICVVLETQHRTPGNLRAFVQASLRSVRTGKSMDVRFGSTEKVEVIPLTTRKMEFSYKDGEDYVFTDPETFETVNITPEILGSAKDYLVENQAVTITFVNERP